MKHYSAAVQCQGCGHRFTICVHSARLVAGGAEVVVLCPNNGSKVRVPVESLAVVESCPAGTVSLQAVSRRNRSHT